MNIREIKNKSSNFIKIVKRACGLPLYPIYYLSYLAPRSRKIWAFGTERNFTDNFKYLFLYVANNEKDKVKAVWISRSKNVAKQLREEGYKAYLDNSFWGIYYALRSKYYFLNENSADINFWLSGGTKKIILYHAMPFKKVGYDATKGKYSSFLEPKGIKKIILRLLIPWGFERKDFVIATSPLFQKIMASAFRVNEDKVIITGSPRNDIFFNEIKNSDLGDDKSIIQQIKDLKDKGKKIIFYLPTWRDTGGNPLADANFDFSILKKFLNLNNAIFISKFHIRTDVNEKDWQKMNSEEFLVLPSNTDIYQILPRTDILITDYSSIFFDFLLINKPTIFFPYDFRKYVAEDRELYFDYDEFTPGPKVYNFKELLNQIEHFLKREDGYEKQREKIKNLCFSYVDGNSSQRIFKTIYNETQIKK
ncbi:CDP-glycerol glycerophosphotransferase family protein [Patescibacteria group bacterium]|nr:CDP-glycerol glycerophosphotransferase family protein [Patescibacteria group bacterium]